MGGRGGGTQSTCASASNEEGGAETAERGQHVFLARARALATRVDYYRPPYRCARVLSLSSLHEYHPANAEIEEQHREDAQRAPVLLDQLRHEQH